MDRSSHYERAIEAYLQWRGLCYVAVDETRRAVWGDTPVKSADFIVCSQEGARLVVDVKGRRFPGGKVGKHRYVWECWSTREDIDSLARWAGLLGPEYQGLLLFTYHILPAVELPEETEDLWTWQGRRYLLRAVPVRDYRQHMRQRSSRWGTVTLPRAAFRSLVRPMEYFVSRPSPVPCQECPF